MGILPLVQGGRVGVKSLGVSTLQAYIVNNGPIKSIWKTSVSGG